MKRKILGRLLTMLLVAAMVFTLLPASAIAAAEWWGGDEYADDAATQADETKYEYNIFFLDCGRKYYSVDSIKQFIDNASAAEFNYIQLAVGNDGLRFLLNDMSLTVNGTTYESDAVKSAIHTGNEAYYNFDVDELTQSEMDTIIAYASSKGMGVIPCVNTPGHMDAILDAAEALTGKTCSYNGSTRTIDVTNSTAVAFTQALLQKYMTYFAGKGCKLFNMGADEYANDKFTSGSMGFGNLQSTGKYSYYVDYVNQVATMIENSGMTPMAFNDGIYFNNNTTSGTFDTDIIVCYWSNGWDGYTPMPATTLANMGFSLINTHGSYYWVLGKSNWQCDASKASGFSYKEFQGSTIDKPAGSMFCVWADYPGAETEASVIRKTSATIAAFGKTLPAVSAVIPEPGITITPSEGGSTGTTLDSTSGTASVTLDAGEVVTWHWDTSLVNLVSADNTVNAYAVMDSLDARRVTITPVANVSGTAAITAEKAGKTAATYTVKVTDGSEETEEQVIKIAVGEERTIPLGANAVLNTNGLEKSIATVTATPNKVDGKTEVVRNDERTEISSGSATGVISDGNGNYLVINGSSISNTTKIAEATTFTVKFVNGSGGYSIYGNGRYLSVSNWSLNTSTSHSTWKYSSDKGFYSTVTFIWSEDYYLNYNNDWKVTTGSGNGFLYGTHEETTGAVDQTLITFKGVAAGTTYVTIDGKTYKIVVTDKAPDDAMTDDSIKLEYWITNEQVYNDQNKSASNMSITTATTGATTDNGIAIADIAPNPAYSFFDGTVTVYYWQAMRLDADNLQTSTSGDDETADGTTLTHIRYHGGAWQYKTADGIWRYFQSTDQLVAYYLQKTEVTEEIDTYVKDWGYTTDGTTPDTSSSKGQVALTVAVVYPDGTVSPAEGSMYANSTSIFNYWNSRDIGIVAPTNNSDYTISKITVTDGTRDSNSSANVWYTSDSITWDKKDLEDGTSKWYDETVVWDKDTNAGTTPMVNGKASNITWSAKNTAKLVLIYLETVQKETNLNVVYYNDNDKEEIFSMQVAMTYNQGDTEPTYANSLYLYGTVNADGTVTDGTLIAKDKSSWLSNVVGDAEYLPDAAYVVNAANKAQTFSKTLSTIPGVAAKYKSGVYQYISADISSDGKTLTLHYAINASKLDKKYIFDFGLPIEIPLSELVRNYDEIEYLSVDGTNLFKNSVKTAHGTLSYDSSSKSIVFTLDKTVDTQAPLTGSFRVKYMNATELSKAITIALIPASNVLYEENFLTESTTAFTTGNRASWNLESTTKVTSQQTHKTSDATQRFGFDTNYEACTGRNGAWVVSGMSADMNASKALTTTFYGNAIDIIGSCAPDSGKLMAIVKKVDENKGAVAIVDTRYKDTIEQVPLAHLVLDDADAAYTVTLLAYYQDAATISTVATQSLMRRSNSVDRQMAADLAALGLSMSDVQYYSAADAVATMSLTSTQADTIEHEAGTHVEIDGFRVYRSTASADYIDSEKNIGYQNILDVVNGEFVAYTETNGAFTATVETYENAGGPQNEIYLANGQSVMFRVDCDSVQVSLRAVSNETSWANSKDGDKIDISSNTEMYYTVNANNGVITIMNRGNGLLAIGNVKLPDSATVTTTSELSEDVVVANLRAALQAAPSEPDQPVQPDTFTPDTFKVNGIATNFFRHKIVTLRVTVSKDVDYVTINDVKYQPNKLMARIFGYSTITITKSVSRGDNGTYTVIAYNNAGTASASQTWSY